jgi:hypothetical protein
LCSSAASFWMWEIAARSCSRFSIAVLSVLNRPAYILGGTRRDPYLVR